MRPGLHHRGHDPADARPRRRPERAHAERRAGGGEPGQARLPPRHHQAVHEHEQRDREHAAHPEDRPEAGQLGGGQPGQTALGGLEIDLDEQRQVVEPAGIAAASATSPYDRPRYSAMRNAAAPITGGMIWPAVRRHRLDRRRQVRRVAGPLHHGDGEAPSTTTLETALPDTVPKSVDETTATLAEPPR